MDMKGKKVLVLGFGDTGVSAVRWLVSNGAHVVAADSRPNPPRAPELQGIHCETGPFRQAMLEGVDMLVISPGVSINEPVVGKAAGMGIPVMGDVELFAREIASKPSDVIAITGSNGKSTVTSMVGEMCAKAGLDTVVAGNIGLPVLDTLGTAHAVYVLELSSFQLETVTSLNARAAAVPNVSEDHLDRHASLQAYAHAKSAIFSGNGTQVLNRDDAASMAMRQSDRKVLTF